MMSMTSLDVDF